MRCDEIRERFVDLLYTEHGTPPASPELRAHVDSCPSCQKELQELRGVQSTLLRWEDEPLLRPVTIPSGGRLRQIQGWTAWRLMRYAAITAMLVLSFLALANADISWRKGEFSFRTSLFARSEGQGDYYTKTELRDLLKRVLDDSESRMIETNQLMTQRLMEMMDQERLRDLRLIRGLSFQSPARN